MNEIWIATKPDGSHTFCTFNPVETSGEIATYQALGWKWVKFVKSSD